MVDTDKYEGHTEGKWIYCDATIFATAKGGNEIIAEYPCWNYNTDQLITKEEEANLRLMTDAPLLLAEVKRLREAYMIERQIVQAFYDYRDRCCYDHCEAWMLEKGYRVMVDGQSEWVGEEE